MTNGRSQSSTLPWHGGGHFISLRNPTTHRVGRHPRPRGLPALLRVTGISALIGVVIAHAKVDQAGPVLGSHYRFQIRTFWIGLVYLAIGIPLCLALIGIPIFGWWFIWSLVRMVKGTLLVIDHKPVANPTSWLFG